MAARLGRPLFTMFNAQIVMSRKPKRAKGESDRACDPAPLCPVSVHERAIVSEESSLFCVELVPNLKGKKRYTILSNRPHLEKRQGVTENPGSSSYEERGVSVYVYDTTVPAMKKLRDDPELKEVFYDDFCARFNA